MATTRPIEADDLAGDVALDAPRRPGTSEVLAVARALVAEVQLATEVSRASDPGPADLRSLELVRRRLALLLAALYGDGRRPTAAEAEGLRVIRDLLHEACAEWELEA